MRGALLGGIVWAFAALHTPGLAADFTDSAGRHVDVPEHATRIIPAGPPADVLLYALAPDAMAGLVEPWTSGQATCVPEAFRALAKIPRITAKAGVADVGVLKAFKPGLVVDYGDVNADYAALADKMEAALGTPYVLLDGRLEAAPGVVRKLGAALGRGARAEEIAGALDRALDRLAFVKGVPPDARVAIYYARGKDGLQAVRAGSSLGEALELAGARNVVPSGQGAFVAMKIEDVVALKPTVVILADPAAGAPDSALRKALPAGTRFLFDRGSPYPWMEKPPSINRLIGALALAERLYPDRAKGDVAEASALARVLFGEAVETRGLAE